jgi:hypothetical protein
LGLINDLSGTESKGLLYESEIEFDFDIEEGRNYYSIRTDYGKLNYY